MPPPPRGLQSSHADLLVLVPGSPGNSRILGGSWLELVQPRCQRFLGSLNRPGFARGSAALEREAARRGHSLNKTALALLREALGLEDAGAPEEYDDLDELAGTWSKSEAARFAEALRAQRPVDAKLWR